MNYELCVHTVLSEGQGETNPDFFWRCLYVPLVPGSVKNLKKKGSLSQTLFSKSVNNMSLSK